MSVDLSDQSLHTSWKDLTTHNSITNWILFSFHDNTNKLYCSGSGSGGIDELRDKLDSTQVQFGAFRVVGVDDRETTVSRRPKFIWFTSIGGGVGILKKARVSVMKPELSKFFESCVVNIQISDKDELNKIEIGKKLLASGGAHKPSHYEFAENDNVLISEL